MLIVDGTLVPTRDHTIAAPSKDYRYSTNLQVVIDADTRLVVAIGDPQAGNRNDCVAYRASGVHEATGGAHVIADGGYHGPNCQGVIIPHRKPRDGTPLPEWKENHNTSHRQVRARVEHVFARMKNWKLSGALRVALDGGKSGVAGLVDVAGSWCGGVRLEA